MWSIPDPGSGSIDLCPEPGPLQIQIQTQFWSEMDQVCFDNNFVSPKFEPKQNQNQNLIRLAGTKETSGHTDTATRQNTMWMKETGSKSDTDQSCDFLFHKSFKKVFRIWIILFNTSCLFQNKMPLTFLLDIFSQNQLMEVMSHTGDVTHRCRCVLVVGHECLVCCRRSNLKNI